MVMLQKSKKGEFILSKKIYLLILPLILFPFATSSSDRQIECNGKVVPQGEVFMKKTGNEFQFASNGANLVTVVEAIRKESRIKIGIPQARQAETVTFCINRKPIMGILKSVLKTNYVLVFDGNNKVVDVSVLQEGTEENTNLPSTSQFNGKVVVKGNVANIFHVPSTESKYDIEQYILSRHQVLDGLNKNHPKTDFNAQISFSSALSKDQLLEALEDYDVVVSNLNTINGEYVGGNEVADGMTLREAVNKADAAEIEFLNVHCMEEATSDQTSVSEECTKMNASHNNIGTMFYGAMVTAKPEKLQAIRDKSKYARLVNPMWSGAVNDALSREYKVKNTAVPLIPENK
jgi:hypothetical protein